MRQMQARYAEHALSNTANMRHALSKLLSQWLTPDPQILDVGQSAAEG